MHHHYLSRAPWNADMKHVGRLRSWIIFGPQPEGICVESSSHCFLLLRTFGTNIYQSTNYWTHVCPGTCKHSVYREGCVCARIPVEEFIVCNMCLSQFCLQTYVVQNGPVGDWAVAPCSNLLFEVCYGHFRQFQTLTLTSRQQAVKSMPRRECFSSGDVKGSDYSLRANSIYTC